MHFTKSTCSVSLLALAIGLAVNGYSQSFLTNGLVAYYPFNGNANDASGYANNPSLNTAVLTADRFKVPLSAYSFSGTQKIQYANQPQLGTTNLTVSCWVQTANTFDGFTGLVCKGGASNPWVGFQVGIYQNHLQVETDFAGFAGSTPINDGRWHSLCAVFDHSNGRLQFFVDANLDSAYSTPAATLISTNQLNVGVERQSVNFFTGSIDAVRIYNRALSASEIQQLYIIESGPRVNFVKAFTVDYSNLTLGSNYVLQASGDLINWTNYGNPFTATSVNYTNTTYQSIDDWSKLFFRLQGVP